MGKEEDARGKGIKEDASLRKTQGHGLNLLSCWSVVGMGP